MNILIVTDILYPDVKGGAGRMVIEVGKGLVQKGHNVYILAPRLSSNLRSKEQLNGTKIYRYEINPCNALSYIISSCRSASRTFKQILSETTLDFIIFNQPLSALGVFLSGKINNIPKIYTFHSSWQEEYYIKTNKKGIGFFLRGCVEKRVLDKCRKVVVLSQYSRDSVLRLYPRLSLDIEVISGGVDLDKFKPSDNRGQIRNQLNIPQDKSLLLTVRHLTVRMGLENLIKAMVEVTQRYKDILLIIGGRGFLEPRLKHLTEKLNLQEYIKFVGALEDDKLVLYYQAADVFLLPTKHLEGFGLVTLESLACGTPVLGTPVGGTIEILQRFDKRMLFKDTSADSIAKSIIEYIGNPINRDELRKRCRQFVTEHYSWDKTVSMLEEKILSLK